MLNSTAPGRATRTLLCAAMILAVPSSPPALGQTAEIAKRRAADRAEFTDAQIIAGFLKVAFGAEYNLDDRIDRIRKYAGPVRVYAESRAMPDRRRDIANIVADIRARVANLDIAMTDDRDKANVVVRLVRNRDLRRTVRRIFGPTHAREIQHSLDPQCLSGFAKDESYRIQRSDVILVADAGHFIFYDCAYEEMLQALGPINDDASVPWTMFNDDVQMGFFGIYDQYLLNIMYHPKIRAGMTAAEVKAVIPDILPSVRAWVAERNLPTRRR